MITFDRLWEAHGSISDVDYPCLVDGKPAFEDQCAIRLGYALARCGFDTRSFPGAEHCWHHPKSEGHILRAQEFADALKQRRPDSFDKARSLPVKDFKRHIAGKKGIIFFKDYALRRTDPINKPTGDHIDLWNGWRMTKWSSWIRITTGLSLPGYWSDFEKSGEILFWRALK